MRKSTDTAFSHPLASSSARSKSCSNLAVLPHEDTITLVEEEGEGSVATTTPTAQSAAAAIRSGTGSSSTIGFLGNSKRGNKKDINNNNNNNNSNSSNKKDKGEREASLTLTLGSTSFLDTTVFDGLQRLYVTDSRNSTTNISREDRIQGVVRVCTICWTPPPIGDAGVVLPVFSGNGGEEREKEKEKEKATPPPKNPATIQMAHGRRYYVEDFLKRTKLTR